MTLVSGGGISHPKTHDVSKIKVAARRGRNWNRCNFVGRSTHLPIDNNVNIQKYLYNYINNDDDETIIIRINNKNNNKYNEYI